jgi:hypothetical protein
LRVCPVETDWPLASRIFKIAPSFVGEQRKLSASRTGVPALSKSGGLSKRQSCYGRSLSISALSAASIVRYDASTAITRDPASAIQPLWPTHSISAHCSESSRAPRIELVPLIICAARRMVGTSPRAAASRSAERTGGVCNHLPQCRRPSEIFATLIEHVAVECVPAAILCFSTDHGYG